MPAFYVGLTLPEKPVGWFDARDDQTELGRQRGHFPRLRTGSRISDPWRIRIIRFHRRRGRRPQSE